MIIVGIDFGDVRTGIAVCDKYEMMASDAGCVHADTYKKALSAVSDRVRELKAELIAEGYAFKSDTDTEVAALLLDRNYKLTDGDKYKAIKKTLGEVKGAYAFAILFADDPTRIWATKKDSPLIVGVGKDENYVASDITAILRHTRDYYQISPSVI